MIATNATANIIAIVEGQTEQSGDEGHILMGRLTSHIFRRSRRLVGELSLPLRLGAVRRVGEG